MSRILILLILTLLLPSAPIVARSGMPVWMEENAPECIDEWMSTVTELLNSHDGSEAYNSHKPYYFDEYGQIANANDRRDKPSDLLDHYEGNRSAWMWDEYGPHAFRYLEVEVPSLHKSVRKCLDRLGSAKSEVPPAAAGRFEYPRVSDGVFMDHCLRCDAQCDTVAADYFCHMQALGPAVSVEMGVCSQSMALLDGKKCHSAVPVCFWLIECGASGSGPADGGRVFEHPRMRGALLDHCLRLGAECDQAAADDFCRGQGYNGAREFKTVLATPTYMRLDDRYCKATDCVAFSSITCALPGERPPD